MVALNSWSNMKKGDTWVSAVLYIALGTIVVAMLLAAGLPVINKIRDRNTVLQTKEVMFGINNAVRTVMREGPGSQRSYSIDIGQGELTIDADQDLINWTMESKAILSEPDVAVYEGDLELATRKGRTEGTYNIVLTLRYSGVNDLVISEDGKITGRSNLIIKNNGIMTSLPEIEIRRV